MLKHSFDHWKETFKTRMKDTYAYVKRTHTHQARRVAATSGRRGPAGGGYGAYHPPAPPRISQHTASPQPQQTLDSAAGTARDAHAGGTHSPGSSEHSSHSPSENYVAKMREGMRGAAKKGSLVARGMVDKMRSMREGSAGLDAGRVSLTPQGTIDTGLHPNGGRHAGH